MIVFDCFQAIISYTSSFGFESGGSQWKLQLVEDRLVRYSTEDSDDVLKTLTVSTLTAPPPPPASLSPSMAHSQHRKSLMAQSFEKISLSSESSTQSGGAGHAGNSGNSGNSGRSGRSRADYLQSLPIFTTTFTLAGVDEGEQGRLEV